MTSSRALTRRAFGTVAASLGTTMLLAAGRVKAAAPDGAGAVMDMVAALQAARSLAFTAQSNFGASVTQDRLRTLGSRASVVLKRPDSIFAVFGDGAEPDVQLLVSGGEATLFRLSLAAKTVLRLAPENGWAFAVPGLFIPFLGLLGDDAGKDFFGGINAVMPVAEGAPGQTTLVSVMGGGFTGEVWIDRSNGLPARTTGTWFGARGGVAASAAVDYSGWTSEAPAGDDAATAAMAGARSVGLDDLGL